MGKMKWTLHQRGKLIDLGQVDAADERAGIKKLLEGRAWKGDGWRIKVGDSALGFDEEDVVRLTGSGMDQERAGQMEERKLSVSVPGLDIAEALKQKELEAALDGLPRKTVPDELEESIKAAVAPGRMSVTEPNKSQTPLSGHLTDDFIRGVLQDSIQDHLVDEIKRTLGIDPPKRKPQHGRNIHVGSGPCVHCHAEVYEGHSDKCPDYGECSRCKAGMHEAHKLACPSAPKEQHDCKECGGQGLIVKRDANGPGRREVPCPRCTPARACSHCQGSGVVLRRNLRGYEMAVRCPRCTPPQPVPGYQYNAGGPYPRHHPKVLRAIHEDAYRIGGSGAIPRVVQARRNEQEQKTTYQYEVMNPDGTIETRAIGFTDQELML